MRTHRRHLRCLAALRWLALALCLAGSFGLATSARADEPQLSLHLENEAVFANLPFVLQVVARGFEENPTPTLSKLNIPGCRVTSLGVTPQVSSMVQIYNGQRSEQRSVTFVFRFRIEASQAGVHSVPALTATQGDRKASSPPGQFVVKAVDETRDMQLRLVLPNRPLWVGETVEGSLDWYLRRDVGNRSFAVPLFDQDEWVEVEAPPSPPTHARLPAFHAGSRSLELPFDQQKATLDGVEYSRFRFQFRLTPTKPGILNPPPARVVAELQTGYGRDLFGFQVPQSTLFQSVAKPVKVEIRALPQSGRPDSFKNAVGQAFSIDVQANRTVVRVGDPVELRVLLRGNGRLSGLILPDVAAMGLSPTLFSAPEEAPSGELLDDGKGKLFRVSVRLRSLDAKEIPALAFSYFDPESGKYETIRSQPIALSVKGSAVVSAGDVVTNPPPAGTVPNGRPASQNQAGGAADAGLGLSLVGADLALSDERLTLQPAPSLRRLAPLVAAGYGLAALLAVAYVLLRRRRSTWQIDAAIDEAKRRAQADLLHARTAAARDAAPRICASLRALRAQLALPADEGRLILEKLETEAYAPGAAEKPLPASLCSDVEALLRAWGTAQPKSTRVAGATGLRLIWWVPFVGAAVSWAGLRAPVAQPAGAVTQLAQARQMYQSALAEGDRDRRRNGFAQAESLLHALSRDHADCPQLAADWGNAALLAQEPGRAVLAYRRALALDPTLSRARRNLSFLRDRLPDWLPRPKRSDGLSPLLWFQQSLTAAHRHVVMSWLVLLLAALFCADPLLARWRARRGASSLGGAEAGAGASPSTAASDPGRFLRRLAILPGLLGLVVMGSILGEADPRHDAVVLLPGGLLRAADSSGAPPAFAHPLPAGSEVRIEEPRGPYTRVRLSDGQGGWVQTSTVEALAGPIGSL